MADRNLDCKRLRCPMPIVKVSRMITEMSPGQTLSVEADDPAFGADLKAWVAAMGHELVEFSAGPVQQAVIRKSRNGRAKTAAQCSFNGAIARAGLPDMSPSPTVPDKPQAGSDAGEDDH